MQISGMWNVRDNADRSDILSLLALEWQVPFKKYKLHRFRKEEILITEKKKILLLFKP